MKSEIRVVRYVSNHAAHSHIQVFHRVLSGTSRILEFESAPLLFRVLRGIMCGWNAKTVMITMKTMIFSVAILAFLITGANAADDGKRCARCGKLTMLGGNHLCVKRKKAPSCSFVVKKEKDKTSSNAKGTVRSRRRLVVGLSGQLGLIQDVDGAIIGMLGHKLGEAADSMNELDGAWGEWMLGRKYEGQLPNKILGFSMYSYEYDNKNRLHSIALKGRIGSQWSRQDISDFQQDVCDMLERKYGFSFTKSTHDNVSVSDSYHHIIEKGADGWPKRQIDLYVIPQEDDGFVLYLKLAISVIDAMMCATPQQLEACTSGLLKVANKINSVGQEAGGNLGLGIEQIKAWYNDQLRYNGYRELHFEYKRVFKFCGLTLVNENGNTVEIQYFPDVNKIYTFPVGMAPGFAKQLLEARIMIYKCENDR